MKIMAQKEKENRVAYSFKFFPTHQWAADTEYWLNVHGSKSEIKPVELVCVLLSLLHMYELQNTDCIILVIPYKT